MKIFYTILSALMLTAATTFAQTWNISATAADSVIATLTFGDSTLTISGTGAMRYDYTSVYELPWYDYRNNITTLVIEEGVTSIGMFAFAYDYSRLTGTLTLPNSVTLIGDYAFSGCSGFTGTLTIPDSVTNIGELAFSGCSGLTTVNFNAIDCITNPAYDCSTGTCYVYSAFKNCTNLTTLNIGENVTKIPMYAFMNCSSLTELNIGNSVNNIKYLAFWNCSSLSSITIPNSVTTIGENAFWNCSGLTELTIGNSVTYIGVNAFQNCTGLTSVNFNAINCTHMADILNIPGLYLDGIVFKNCTNLTTLNIGENVTTIPKYAFYDCSSLTNINILKSTLPVVILDTTTFYNVPNNIPINVPCGMGIHYENSAWVNYFNNFQDSNYIAISTQSNDTTMGTAQVTQLPTCTNNLATVQATANNGYYFLKWNDENTDNPRTVLVTQDTVFTAIFEYDIIGEVTDTIEIPDGEIMVVLPDSTSAQVAWLANEDATEYELTIYENTTDTVFSIELNANGEPIGVTIGQHAPSKAPRGLLSGERVLAIKIMNLLEGTTYSYKMVTYGEGGAIIGTSEGTFTTLGAPSSINEVYAQKLTIYPNPAKNQLRITNYELRDRDYTIFSVTGQVLMQGALSSETTIINIEALPIGVYFIKVENKVGKFVKK